MHWSGLWGENHWLFWEHPGVALALKLPGFLVLVGRFVDTRDNLFEARTCLAYAECRLLKAKHIRMNQGGGLSFRSLRLLVDIFLPEQIWQELLLLWWQRYDELFRVLTGLLLLLQVPNVPLYLSDPSVEHMFKQTFLLILVFSINNLIRGGNRDIWNAAGLIKKFDVLGWETFENAVLLAISLLDYYRLASWPRLLSFNL